MANHPDRPPGLAFIGAFLDRQQADEVLAWLATLQFAHGIARGRPMRRAYAQFGHTYAATGRRLEDAPPFPAELSRLCADVAMHCPPRTAFDQCIVTRYPTGAGIGWHVDAPFFDDC